MCVVCDIDKMSLWVVDFVFLLLKVCIGDWQAPVSYSSEGVFDLAETKSMCILNT